jgi:malonyl-CoA/methylmalonyl-CoA synthetase
MADDGDGNLFDLIRGRMPADPATPALEVPGGGPTYGYGDLDRRSARLAGALRAAGVAKGDRVAVQVEKSPEAVLLYLACLRAGAAYLPLNTAYTLPELDYFFGDAGPRAIVCDPARREGVAALAGARGAGVLTLGADGAGTLVEEVASSSSRRFASGPKWLK